MDEIIAWLSQLIDFDTTAAGPDAEECVLFIRQALSSRGALVRTFVTEGGARTGHHLLAEIPGDRPDAVMLHAHLDTADFGEGEGWLFPAEHASRRRGCVCGRGALDCKGPLAVWMKLISDAAAGGPRAYTLRLLVSDLEESGGEDGLGRLLAQHPEVLADVRLVIGEGGGFPFPFHEHVYYTLQTGERETEPDLFGDAEDPGWERAAEILSMGVERGYYSPALLDYAREAPSLPGRRLDIRPLYDGMEAFFAHAPVSHVCARFSQAFEAALRRELPNARLMPCITPGYSDNRWFRKAGIPTAGFFPLDIRNSLAGIHGANEYISEASLALAYRTVSRALEAVFPEQ